MKLVSTIVDKNFAIIGFEIEGTEREFGGLIDNHENIVRTVPITEMFGKGFRNSQIDCRNKKIREIGSFEIRKLPIKMIGDNGKGLVQIDNNITLLKRLLVNGKLEGFEISVCGANRRFRVKDIISLSKIFNGENYVVKTKEGKAGFTKYLAGKAGCSLQNLPELELGSNKETGKQARTRTATNSKNSKDVVVNPELPDEYDIISLFDEVRSLNGLIFELPDKVYESANIETVVEAPQFKRLGIGSIGEPYIRPSRDGMNVNCTFRIPGNVSVEFKGNKLPITTFVTRSHHIFKDGEVYDGELGLVIRQDKMEELKSKFAASLGLTEVTNDKVIAPIRSIYDDNTLRAFKVDTRRLSIMSKEKAMKARLNEKKIAEIVNKLVEVDTRFKYFNGKIRQLADNEDKVVKKELYGMFAGMNDEMLNACVEAGIDVYTGGFVETIENPKLNEQEAAVVNSKIKGEYNKKAGTGYSVKFALKGFATIPSAKDIELKTTKASKYISEEFSKQIDEVNAIKDAGKLYKVCEANKKQLEKAKNKLVSKLFYHNIASLVLGGYTGYKMNKSHWDTTNKEGVYICNLPGLDKLQMTIKGGLKLV